MSGWQFESEILGPSVRRLTVGFGAEPASFRDVFRAWASGDAMVQRWGQTLADVPFAAFNWECPALVAGSLAAPFECVAVDNPTLATVQPEPEVFAEHWRPGQAVARFANLRGDSELIAPTPPGAFTHLAAFARTAPGSQQAALWQATGTAVLARVSAVPVWLSTAGLGVYWVHIRLDPRPKYYRYVAYKKSP